MKALQILVPENATATVLQNYDGGFAADPSIKVVDFGHYSSVAIAENHPEAFNLMLALKQETDRVKELIVGEVLDGMEQPRLLDHYGLAFTWEATVQGIEVEPYDLSGYAA